jgi:alcohol dehydrogenase (cytochrome c)
MPGPAWAANRRGRVDERTLLSFILIAPRQLLAAEFNRAASGLAIECVAEMLPWQSRLRVMMTIGAMAAISGRSQTPAAYTARQAADGLAAYQANCATCHLQDLAGRNEAPPLAGGNFMSAWGSRTTAELIRYIQATMPPSNRGGLSDETYANIAGFFLQANGAAPGGSPLTVSTPVRIDSVANGQMPAGLREMLAEAAYADQAMAPRAAAPKGITVAGQLKNFVPITDNTLRHPDPADWLMARGNYQAWSYSPLAQITPENLGRLQLVWVWAMNDGGANEPTPIVHDGIIYLTNTSNTLQALNGRTGDLIWENRIGPESTRAYGATRTLAIYDDKLLLIRPRRAHRQNRLADRHRATERGVQQHLRRDRHQRQGSDGHDRLWALRRGLLHQCL